MVQFNPRYNLVFPLFWRMHGYHYDNVFIIYMKQWTIIPNCTKANIKPQHLSNNKGFFQLVHTCTVLRHNFREFSQSPKCLHVDDMEKSPLFLL